MLSTGSGLSFAWENLAGLLDDGVADIARAHWREIGLHQEEVPLDVDWGQLLREEDSGRYRVFVARRDGRIVGYAPFMLFWPSRYQNTLHVQDDTIYVVPDEPCRAALWLQLVEEAVKTLPRPCKFIMRVRPQFGGYALAEALKRQHGMELSELVLTTILR